MAHGTADSVRLLLSMCVDGVLVGQETPVFARCLTSFAVKLNVLFVGLFLKYKLTMKPLAQQGSSASVPATVEAQLVRSTSAAGSGSGSGSGSAFIPADIMPAIERMLQVGQGVTRSKSPGF